MSRRTRVRPHGTEPPSVVGLLAADATTITMRVMLLTVPSQRDPLTRALREAALAALAQADACGRRT